MLECIQAGRVEASCRKRQRKCCFTGYIRRGPTRQAAPTEQAGCLQPCVPPLHAPQCPYRERSSRLPNFDAAEGHFWSVYLGNKSFLIPWQRGCLQSPRSNRAVFIEFLCAEYIHAWDFNSFVTVKHLVFYPRHRDGNYSIFVQILVCLDQDWAKIKYVGLRRFPGQIKWGGGKSLLPSGLFCDKVCHKISDME